MTAVAFDTLKFAKSLRDANVPQDQAEGITKAFAEATGEQIATKADLKQTESAIKADLKELEPRLKESELRLLASLSENRADTLKWMFGTIGFQTIVILGAVAALNHFGH